MKNNLLSSIIDGLGITFQVLWNIVTFFYRLLFPTPKKPPHQSQFGNASDYLSLFNKGIFFGSRGTTLADAHKHCIIFGSSGIGKTSKVIINTLLSKRASDRQSLVIRDASGELYAICAPYLQSIGYDCMVTNLSDASLSSHSFNPLEGDKTIGQLMQISANLLNKNASHSGDPYWINSATEACTIFLRILKEQQPMYHTLYNLKTIVESFAADPSSLDGLYSKTKDNELLNAYKALINIPEKNLLNVIATLKSSALMLFADPNMAYVTSASTIRFEDMRRKKVAIFIQSSVLEDSHTAPVQSLFFSELLSYLMKKLPERSDNSVLFILDEAGSLTFSRNFLETIITTARKYKIALCLSYQSPLQLDRAYSRDGAENIRSNAFSKLYMSGMNQQTSEELERMLGITQHIREDGTKYSAPLMDSFSIRTMPEDRALLVMGNRLPLHIKLTPYYKIGKLKRRSRMHAIPIIPITKNPLHVIDLKKP